MLFTRDKVGSLSKSLRVSSTFTHFLFEVFIFFLFVKDTFSISRLLFISRISSHSAHFNVFYHLLCIPVLFFFSRSFYHRFTIAPLMSGIYFDECNMFLHISLIFLLLYIFLNPFSHLTFCSPHIVHLSSPTMRKVESIAYDDKSIQV